MFNALSVTFPDGEKFLMDAVRPYAETSPPRLAREIRAFCQQEAIHRREHDAMNRNLVAAGYDIDALTANLKRVLSRLGARRPIDRLLGAMCLEHLTAILAREFISKPGYFKHASDDQRQMWLWHASEEIEHKGVAFDAWNHATKGRNGGLAWARRSAFMLRLSLGFAKNRALGVVDLLRQDGVRGARAWVGLLRFAFGRPGVARGIWRDWAAFFRPGFHPWQQDDRHLIALAESDYEAAILPSAAKAGAMREVAREQGADEAPSIQRRVA